MDLNALQRVQYRAIDTGDVGRLKLLNSIIFPINFGEEVYQHAMACGDVTQLGEAQPAHAADLPSIRPGPARPNPLPPFPPSPQRSWMGT